jgi:hypothetical protein
MSSLMACSNPIKVGINLVTPCDQETALSGVSTYKVQVRDNGAVINEGQFSSEDTGVVAFEGLEFGSAIDVSVHGWPGPNTPATVATVSKVAGRTLPMELTAESGVDSVDLNVVTGMTHSFGRVTGDDGACKILAESNGRHAHSSTFLPGLNKVLIVGGAVVNPQNPAQEALLASVELFDPTTGTFENLPPMGQARAYHTATLLADNTVLVVGGFGDVNGLRQPLGSWMRIDPTQSDSTTIYTFGAMSSGQGRAHHTATRLDNLETIVVIAGGCVDTGCDSDSVSESAMAAGRSFSSIEIFDSATNTVSVANTSLINPRAMHAATSLGGGFILFTGGIGTGGVAECNVELYSYLRDTISLSGNLPECPHLHQQVTLSSESAMIIGGEIFAGSSTADSNRIYIWRNGSIETNVLSLNTARSRHEAAMLDDGSVIVVGGIRVAGGAVAELISFQAAVSGYVVSSVVTPPAQSRDWLSAVKMPNNQVLITGGRTAVDSTVTVTDAELFFGP